MHLQHYLPVVDRYNELLGHQWCVNMSHPLMLKNKRDLKNKGSSTVPVGFLYLSLMLDKVIKKRFKIKIHLYLLYFLLSDIYLN